MADNNTLDKWTEFVNLASKEMARQRNRNFNETVAMYLGDIYHTNFQVKFYFEYQILLEYIGDNFFDFLSKILTEYPLYFSCIVTT